MQIMLEFMLDLVRIKHTVYTLDVLHLLYKNIKCCSLDAFIVIIPDGFTKVYKIDSILLL